MNETPTNTQEKTFDAQIDEDLEMVNTPSNDRLLDDAQFLSRASQASESFLQPPTPDQPEASPSRAKKVAVNLALGAVVVGSITGVAAGTADVIDSKIKEDNAQDQEWSGETADQQQLQEQQMVEENKIVLNLSSSDEK